MRHGMIKPSGSRLTITVGGPDADIRGFDGAAIQKAVELVNTVGGGKVVLTPGVFEIIAPVKLYSNIHLQGSGEETVLRKGKGFTTRFIIDADYGELMATVEDASGFKPGMAIQLFDQRTMGGFGTSTAVITEICGNTIYFDNYLVQDYRAENNGTVNNACSLVEAIEQRDVLISDLAIDGNKDENEYINGCRGGAIYFHKAANCTVENVTVRDFNGDGISWQITEDITIRNCTVAGGFWCGLHPGAGSIRTTVEGCDVHSNRQGGIFICWRVKYGTFRNNKFHHNGRYGINIGHKDTDNLFEGNHIYKNGFCGVLFRPETPLNSAHRNIFVKNIIEDNGGARGEAGYGICIDHPAEGVVIRNNIIRDTGANVQKAGVYIKNETAQAEISGNEMSNHPAGDVIREELPKQES